MSNILFKYILIILLIINAALIFKIIQINKLFSVISNSKYIYNNNTNILKNTTNLYKEFLFLYIENREKFYIKGREHIMKSKGKIYNDSNVITFQDKLNYLLIHESPEDKTKIVDKILFRNYSKDILGKDLCAPILKIYNDIDEINLGELPDKFVLKCNHGSGMNIFCEDKSKFDLTSAKNNLKEWLNINYGLQSFEYQYINIKRKIFAEEFLDKEIINYKFSCFNGEPKLIRVKGKINGINLYNIYYINWTSTNIEIDKPDYVITNKFKKPINLQKMLNYSRLLSSDFCYVRVDFYEVRGTLYLGELTFSPFNTNIKYKNNETGIYLGNFLNISKANKYILN